MRWKEFLQGVGEGVLIFLLILLLFVVYGSFENRWYRVLVARSGSMSPTFEAGDLIIVTAAPPPEKLTPGMVASFVIDGEIVTHRIVAVDNGCIVTKGDANKDIDFWSVPGGCKLHRVSAIYRGRLPYVGYPIAFLSEGVRTVFGSALRLVQFARAEFKAQLTVGADFSSAGQFSSPPP